MPGTARRLAERQLERLKNHKVDVNRIKTIFGGVRKKSTLQLWITGLDDPPPVKDAGDEPPPQENIEITMQGDVTMGVPENERAVFNRMLDVLREQPTVKAVVIVTLEGKQPEPEPELGPEDDPAADLPKMVEKWRQELVNTHKIRPDRFIVLFTTTHDSSGGYFQIWAMPPGQPLPTPDDDDEKDQPSDVVQDPKRRP